MKSAIVSLTRMVAGITLLTTSLHAALITFTAAPEGAGTVTPGGTIKVDIVSSGSAPLNWISADFTLVWNSGVLGTPTFTLGDNLLPSAAFEPTTGVFSWFGGGGVAVPNPYTMLSMTFQAAPNAAAGLYSIIFSQPSQPPFDTLQVGFLGGSSEQPNTSNGSIQVVPEPVNWALGLFACVFTGAATVRWISLKRKSSQAG